ncbi:MAG: hypothetical protein ACRD19_11970, partial [Terriglobia bacterium]
MKNQAPAPVGNLQSHSNCSLFTRRKALRGTAALVAASVLPDFGSGWAAWASTATARNPQPMPAGPVTKAALTVTTASAGAIDRYFPGLSYEKNTLYE